MSDLTAFITDQHFGARSDNKLFLDNYQQFYDHVFFPTLEERGVKRVVGLGDAWENRRTTNGYTLHRAKQMFYDQLARRGIEHVMIYGNHDVYYRDTNEINHVDQLELTYDNIRVIRTHEVVDLGVPFALISWIHKNNLEESLQWLGECEADYLGGHFEIKDFEMTRGQVATTGFDRSLFKRFDHVWSGHFHIRSTIGNITYLGNPSQTNFGDVDLPKGFHLFNPADGSMTPVDNPYQMYKVCTWGDGSVPQDFAGKYGRIRIADFSEVDRAKLDIFVAEARDVAIDIQTIQSTVELDGVLVEQDDTMSTAAIIDEYLQDAVGAKEGLDHAELRSMFHELYQQAAAMQEVE